MKVLFGGVRGTGPVAQADFLRYGGETTSVLIEGAAGERLLLDAGTGMRIIAPHLQLAAGGTMRLLMTHYHLDHLAGDTRLFVVAGTQRRAQQCAQQQA